MHRHAGARHLALAMGVPRGQLVHGAGAGRRPQPQVRMPAERLGPFAHLAALGGYSDRGL
jgi:hypothetical protein